MNSKTQIGLFLVLISLVTLAIGVIPKAVAGGPATSNFLVKIFFDPTTESWSLDTGDIDMNDWPLTKDFITRWAGRTDITMDEYAEIGKMEFDINNQWWPTGPEDPTHSTVAARNVFYDPTNPRHVAALHFRRAIAHLTDKDAYVTQQGGMAYKMETEVPIPALAGYTDYSTLENATALAARSDNTNATGFLYRYSVDAAVQEFWLGGFVIPRGEAARKWFEVHTTVRQAIKSNVDKIPVESTSGFYAGQKIQIGEGVNAEDATIATGGVNPTTRELTITTYTTKDHWKGVPVVCKDTLVEALPNMKFWIRIDDPNRRFAGEHLYSQLTSAGIPAAASADAPGLEKVVTERSACFQAVMVAYKYNIYTGGWSLGADTDWIYDLYHSSMGQYSWATNYAGFKNTEFDNFAYQVKYPTSDANEIMIDRGGKKRSKLVWSAIDEQWVKAKYMPVVELWAAKGVKAYRTGWDGMVNYAGYGTDNMWSYQNMRWLGGAGNSRKGPANTIVQGFKSDVSAISVLSSEWVWDWAALGKIYDTLIARNPYDLSEDTGWMASEWNAYTITEAATKKTVAEFKLRTDLYFHDSEGPDGVWGTPDDVLDPVTPLDVVESLLLPKAAGAGVAWNYPMVMDIERVEVSGQTIKVVFGVETYWALHWAGFMPIFKAALWKTGINAMGAGYSGVQQSSPGVYTAGTFTNAMAARDYRPWEMDKFPAGGNGKNDLTEDGSFQYVFDAYVTGQTITFHAFGGFYNDIYDRSKGGWVKFPDSSWVPAGTWLPPGSTDYGWVPPGTYYKLPVNWKTDLFFHRTGNVNSQHAYGTTAWYTSDRIIDAPDRYRVSSAMPTTYLGTWGSGELQFNPDADLNGDTNVNIVDKVIVNLNYLKTAG